MTPCFNRDRPLNIVLCLLGLSAIFLPASADSGSGSVPKSGAPAVADSGSNIFTPPLGHDQAPTFTEARQGDARLRQILGEKKDGIPDFRTIRALPSLTPDQRKELRSIYDKGKTQVQPLMDQMKALKEKFGGDQQKAAADTQARETFQQLRKQIQEQRKQTWEQAKAQLNEKQLRELTAMRHGELTPPSLRSPNMDGMTSPKHPNMDRSGLPQQPSVDTSRSPDSKSSGEHAHEIDVRSVVE